MWPVRVLHVSDLHAGTAEEPLIESALRALVSEVDPTLVIASGDLTHRNHPESHARAAALLRSLERPLLVVPGNHDIPMLPPGRYTHTFEAFGAEWPETEPVYRSEEIVVCGLNSVRAWRRQAGGLSEEQTARAASVFAEAPPGALRIVALHHQLASPPWRTAKRPVAHRGRVLDALAAAGAELILSGHAHQSSIVERREFQSGEGGLVIATAPGLGHPRPKRRGEARGLHRFDVDETTIRALTYAWNGDGFAEIADRRFPR
jgi:3',5'-cyclic AMP phosphodiesterase CpdA